jgi:hypothetical protein
MISYLLKHIAKMAICIVLSISVTAAYGSSSHSNHKGHSDVLLEILQLKIKIERLQNQQALSNNLDDLSTNMRNQAITLNHATNLLQQYVAIPESRYPNLEMYHQSLTSRAGIMQEFSLLMHTFQEQLTANTLN